jgi:DNA-binding PadR family transcriptional regulator
MSRPRSPQLTTTSYALLGLLAMKPWTTYELAQHMGRSLARLWPRAVSKVYEEPKKLAELGLAHARSEHVGRRPRTVYAITPKGRRALRAWMSQPGRGPVLEFEALMKVFFAENGIRDDTLAALATIAEWARTDRNEHLAVASAYAAGKGMFPERAAQTALTGRFLFEFNDLVLRWSKWAASVAEQWPDDPARAEPDRRIFTHVARRAAAEPPPLDEPD